MRTRAATFPASTRSVSRIPRDLVMPETIGPIRISSKPMPRACAHARASRRSDAPVAGPGRESPRTFPGLAAITQSFATRAESMPPLSPRTNPWRPLSSRWCRRNAVTMRTWSSRNRGVRSTARPPPGASLRLCPGPALPRPPAMDADEAVFHYIDEYSRMAETYDHSVRPRFEPIARRLVGLLAPREGEKVLEIGAGAGDATLEIATRVGPSGLVGAIDASDGQLRVLQRRAAEAGLTNIHQEAMDAGHILYPRGAFDAAVSNLGIPIVRWRQTFSEAFRTLRDGGRLAFSEWDGATDWVATYAEAEKPHLTATPSARLPQLREAVPLLRAGPEREEGPTPPTA